jgi:RND family efflux transporter MFP subunit
MNTSRSVVGWAHAGPLTILAVLLASCAKPEPVPESARPVLLMQVKLGGAVGTSVFAGEVKPRHEIDLGFRIGGKVIGRSVDVGARVTRGQALARLDPADVALQADAQQAAVAATETEYRYAKAEFDRYENLYQQKFISASALDQKRNALDANRAKWEQARAQLSVTQNQASYAILVAPDNGVITAINVEAGQVVTTGQTVMKLAREDEREVAISVPESRIAELRASSAFGVFLWADPQKIYTARVREIAPAVDPVTRTFAVRVSIVDPDAALHWGMTANVVVAGGDASNRALLPLSSIYRKGDTAAVWIYDEKAHTVALRPVAVGQYREDGVIVTGVAGGEWIVAAGVHKLREGETVRPYERSPDTAANASPVRAPVIVPGAPKPTRNLT